MAIPNTGAMMPRSMDEQEPMDDMSQSQQDSQPDNDGDENEVIVPATAINSDGSGEAPTSGDQVEMTCKGTIDSTDASGNLIIKITEVNGVPVASPQVDAGGNPIKPNDLSDEDLQSALKMEAKSSHVTPQR